MSNGKSNGCAFAVLLVAAGLLYGLIDVQQRVEAKEDIRREKLILLGQPKQRTIRIAYIPRDTPPKIRKELGALNIAIEQAKRATTEADKIVNLPTYFDLEVDVYQVKRTVFGKKVSFADVNGDGDVLDSNTDAFLIHDVAGKTPMWIPFEPSWGFSIGVTWLSEFQRGPEPTQLRFQATRQEVIISLKELLKRNDEGLGLPAGTLQRYSLTRSKAPEDGLISNAAIKGQKSGWKANRKGAIEAYVALNQRRRQFGGLPCSRAMLHLSARCSLHSWYLKKYGDEYAHYQDKSHTDRYTVAGAAAAELSTLGTSAGVLGLDEMMGTFFHRVLMTENALLYVGSSTVGSYWVMDVGEGWNKAEAKERRPCPIITFPAAGASDVPKRGVEDEDPQFQDEDISAPGMPFTVRLNYCSPWFELADVKKTGAQFYRGGTPGRKGMALPTRHSSPVNPRHSDSGNSGVSKNMVAICAYTEKPLKSGTKYCLEVLMYANGVIFRAIVPFRTK